MSFEKIFLILFSSLMLANCGGGGGGGDSPPPLATVTLTASDTDLFPGDSTLLTWSSTNATSCTASGSWSGQGGISGEQIVTISEGNNTYSLKCGNSATASVTVVGIIEPTVSIQAIENINALESVEFNATINDPQSRFISSDWSQTSATGESFNYNYTDTTITFTPPQQCNYQTVSPKIVITYDIANNNNGNSASKSATTSSRIVPVIPEPPQNFKASAKSQSADFTWNESVGACSYDYYYSYDNGGLTKDSFKIETSASGEGSLVSIVNDRKIFFAVSATNVTGESELSNEVEITTTGPSNEYTGLPNNQNANFSEIDFWGNIIGDYTGNLSKEALCVKDNITGIIWGIKKPVETSNRHYTYGTYTYYDQSNVINGVNDFGTKNPNGTSCSFADDSNSSLNCNTEDYLINLNEGKNSGEAYCGLSNWKLPSQDQAIQNFNLIDDDSVCCVEPEFWTSTSMNQDAPAKQITIELETTNDRTVLFERSKSETHYVRPISYIDEIENTELDFTIQCIDWEEAIDQSNEDHDPGYSLIEATDRASLISNQTGVDWTVPTLYEMAYFKEKIKESPGQSYKVSREGFQDQVIEPIFEVTTSTPLYEGVEQTWGLIRNSNSLLELDGIKYSGTEDVGRYQMCFKGPAAASLP